MEVLLLAESRMLPLENYGVRCMSMGFLMQVTLYCRMHACCCRGVMLPHEQPPQQGSSTFQDHSHSLAGGWRAVHAAFPTKSLGH